MAYLISLKSLDDGSCESEGISHLRNEIFLSACFFSAAETRDGTGAEGVSD